MTNIRKVIKAVIIAGICLAFLVVGVVVNLALLFLPKSRSGARARCTQLWARLVSAVLGIRIRHAGEEWALLDRDAYFIVSNHLSYVDIIVLAAVRPGSFLSKHDVRDWPVLGWLASLAGTVFVNRDSRRSALPAMQEIRERLSHGVSVVVFPEGTTSDGLRLLEFKPAFFDLPAKARLPVLPVAVRYLSIDGFPVPVGEIPAVAWFGEAALLPNVWRVLGMRELVVRVAAAAPLCFSEEWNGNRKMLAVEARGKVAEVYWMPGDE